MFHMFSSGQSLKMSRLIYTPFFFLSVFIGAMACSASTAWSIDGFTVQDIAIDTTGTTTDAARESGLIQAQTTGLKRLMERLTPQSEHARLPTVDGRNIAPYVASISVDDEKTSSGRYIARLSVRYTPESVRSLLQAQSISYTEPHTPILTLPILHVEGRTILWEDPTPWRQAWASLPVNPLIPLIVPLGEIEDVTQLPTERVAGVGMDDLQPMMRRYNTTDVFVITAVLSSPAVAPMSAEVSLRGIGSSVPDIEIPRSFHAHDGETTDAFLSRTAQTISMAIATAYKQNNAINHAQTENRRVSVHFSGLAEWLSIRERLGKIPAVHKIDIEILGRTEAVLSLQLAGNPSAFRSTFAQYNLSFVEGDHSQPVRIMSTSPTPPLTPSLTDEEDSLLEIPE